ncbi:MAG: hypothetical protein II186_01745 [Erysipelotrichales bacterium]|nr:hypothetical protein [Erysipelotrichales bacterium]
MEAHDSYICLGIAMGYTKAEDYELTPEMIKTIEAMKREIEEHKKKYPGQPVEWYIPDD